METQTRARSGRISFIVSSRLKRSEMERSIELDLASLSNRGSRLRCTPLEMTTAVIKEIKKRKRFHFPS
jgi:hypothetical protein